MMSDVLNRFDLEFALALGLEEALSRTYMRMAMIFDGVEAITNSGLENPFTEMVEATAEMVRIIRVQMTTLDNAAAIATFVRNHRLNISWETKRGNDHG